MWTDKGAARGLADNPDVLVGGVRGAIRAGASLVERPSDAIDIYITVGLRAAVVQKYRLDLVPADEAVWLAYGGYCSVHRTQSTQGVVLGRPARQPRSEEQHASCAYSVAAAPACAAARPEGREPCEPAVGPATGDDHGGGAVTAAVSRIAAFADLIPAQLEAWDVLLDLYDARDADWTLLGGQMTWAAAAEHDREPPRATVDMDVVVDVRARPGMTEWLATWLKNREFELAGASPDGIAHRFIRATKGLPDGGHVQFDILAPEGLGERTKIFTVPPNRTVQVPASIQAIERTSPVQVHLPGGRSGHALVPNLLGAVVSKAAALGILVRTGGERDLVDAAFLLTCMDDPDMDKAEMTVKDGVRVNKLRPLLAPDHPAWTAAVGSGRTANGHLRTGVRALQILLTPRDQWQPA
jgi:hypothetical protein